MNLRKYAQRMAQYNAWMNHRVYERSAALSHEERTRDLGAFFKSLHDTLDHILWADRAFLKHLADVDLVVGPYGQRLHESLADMWAERKVIDRALCDWADSIDPAAADTPTPIRRNQAIPFRDVVIQVFNHQTHHRGQVTTLLMQLGVDPRETDLPDMLCEMEGVR